MSSPPPPASRRSSPAGWAWPRIAVVVLLAGAAAAGALRWKSGMPVPAATAAASATSAASADATATVTPPNGYADPGAFGPHPYPLGSDNQSITARSKWRAAQLVAAHLDDYARASVSRGRDLFMHTFTPAEGLGPYYNERACVACHHIPGVLGRGPIERSARVYGTGRIVNRREMPTKFLPYETLPGYPPFVMPAGFHLLGKRAPPSLLGLGWVEAIEADQILASPHCDSPVPAPDHVCGWAPRRRIGFGTPRFGLKMNVATLEEFIAGALALEMGVLTEFPLAPTDPPVTHPELPALAVIDLANFIAFSTPPGQPLPPERARGASLFATTGCKDCHWSNFEVGGKPTPQMYSDLLAHDMGPARAEGDFDHLTPPGHFRTTPLWGLRNDTGPYLHDAAAATLDEAIGLHGGEAASARDRYRALDAASREELIAMLRSL